ncbi:protein aubergine-like [Wyeomyia smithii]|uniref:protein aubergine-like n=1 Tax=Wyeomyia smithii TaxID=174621 RepID=UPI002467BD3E|nr:protein aubergine-like [Wyeomyia smithii]XP_055525212.1 protein aubergine-like [Wyeomyia smithii]XP_055525213.1 protein aubergine-like [Wyeomyia smithii]
MEHNRNHSERTVQGRGRRGGTNAPRNNKRSNGQSQIGHGSGQGSRPATNKGHQTNQTQQQPQQATASSSSSLTVPTEVRRASIRETATERGAMRGRRTITDIVRTRPLNCEVSKKGTCGRPIMLQANYFRVARNSNENIFQYRVDFNPAVESIRLMHSIIRTLRTILGGYVFDGTQLFIQHKLSTDEMEYPTKEPQTDQAYIVKLRKVGVIDGTTEVAFQMYNLINRKAMGGLKLQMIGRNFFDPEARVCIPNSGLELYPGYETSIRQHEQDVLMCAEIKHKVMHSDTCYSLFRECANRGGNWKDNFKRALLGMVVMANYGTNKTYTISDVEFNTTPEHSFETRNGQITFVQYFKERYNITIRDPRQPMLISRAKPRELRAGMTELLYLVPELVRLTGITDDMRRDFNLMRSLADHTRLTPDRRIARLEAFNRRLHDTQESAEVFNFWKTELDRRLVEVPARTLQPETILLHPEDVNCRISSGNDAEWQNAFRNNPMFATVALNNWYVVVPAVTEKLITGFLDCLKTVARSMRFQIGNPQRLVIPNDATGVYVEKLNQITQKDPQLIMCIVTNDKADRYAAIKKKCCVERAIATQVLKARTITPKGGNTRNLMSVATKVAIQLNCKLGGIPWMVQNPIPWVMVIGYDACHDTKDRSKTFGALVATMYAKNHALPKYFSTVNRHSSGEELSNFMAQNVIKAIRSYQEDFELVLPQQIIIYRDGVGEGQLGYVYQHEIAAIKERINAACKSEADRPKLTFFVVNKRINTRLFHQKRNPAPGTIVDDVITLPERNDFFLVSQSVRQGTVSPTAYNILRDESGLGPDRLQIYTYKQTHLYYNWSGTLGVPAVCQYAHKLAFLAGQYLHQAPHQNLEKKLYYL